MFPGRSLPAAQRGRQRVGAVDRARLYEAMPWIDYFVDPLRFVLDALLQLNFAERHGLAVGIVEGATAAGMIARFVGITEPTVAPMPRWTSGIAATWWCTIGSRETLTSCRRAAGSISPV